MIRSISSTVSLPMRKKSVAMKVRVLNYIPKESFIHSLSGTTKLIIFLSFSFLCGLSFDTRVLLFLLFLSVLGFSLSRIKLSEIRIMSTFLVVFIVMNAILLFIFNPEYGPELYGSRTLLFHIAGKYDMTLEQLFYQFNIVLKYSLFSSTISLGSKME